MAPAILLLPDPRLRRRCAPVDAIDDDVRELARAMLAAMYAAQGRGLAAPQLGALRRLFVMDVAWKDGDPQPVAFVNPVVAEASVETVAREEACLSIPGRTALVRRPAAVTLRWQGLDGQPREGRFEGFAAACVQHEVDHLDGILCIDREEAGGATPLVPERSSLPNGRGG